MKRKCPPTALAGRPFLRRAFVSEQEVLALELRLSSDSISHAGTMGAVTEGHFMRVLRKYLPERYAVETGIILDSKGQTSDQIDIIIFDRHYTPTLLDQQSHRYVPAEAVYGVFEVKPKLDKGYLDYAGAKVASVRKLHRTSVPFGDADGQHPPKKPFPIIAGIVAPKFSWSQGISAPAFRAALTALRKERALDCALGLAGGGFDSFDDKPYFYSSEACLAVFIFRLLQKLQALGTVPAPDWSRYAKTISSVR